MGSAIIQTASGSVCGNRDIVVPRLLDIQYLSQVHSLADVIGPCNCGQFFCQGHIFCGWLPCQRYSTQFWVEFCLDGPMRVMGFLYPKRGLPAINSQNWGAGGFSCGWNGLIWAKGTDTSRVPLVRRTRYTAGESWEHKIYGPRHGSNNFGFGPSVSWKSLYTSTFCPGLNTGYGASLSLSPACLVARAVKLRRANSSAIYKLPRVSCANTSISAVLPSWGIPSIIPTGNIAFLPNV